MLKDKLTLGAEGEKLAIKYFKHKGYKILTTNYHVRGGELDIVASFFNKIIFIEVKTRTTNQYGSGEEAINQKKLDSLIYSAQKYLAANNLLDRPWQIDLLTIDYCQNKNKPEIRHLKNITF